MAQFSSRVIFGVLLWVFGTPYLVQSYSRIDLQKHVGRHELATEKQSEETPGLIELTDSNFVDTFMDLDKKYDLVLMEFYSHWCPACKHFQPTYKRVAQQVHQVQEEESGVWGMSQRVQDRPKRMAVVRIDCPVYTRTCDEFSIQSYPTMLVDTPENFAKKNRETTIMVNPKPRDYKGMMKELKAIVGRDFESKMLPESVNQDGEQSKTDDEEQGNIHVMKQSDIHDKEQSKTNDKEKHDMYVTKQSRDETRQQKKDVHLNTRWDGSAHTAMGKLEISSSLQDITSATIISFENLKVKTLLKGEEQRRALVEWLTLLVAAHPVEECAKGASLVLKQLHVAWPPALTEILSLDDLKKMHICGETKQVMPWNSCAGSTPDTRGYSCGLWQLLHTLMVRMPEKEASTAGFIGLSTVREFIRFFFQCRECSSHFVEYASSVEAKAVKTKDDAILWLWKTHNAVNERLHKSQDGTDMGDPAYPHVQWPPVELCPNCHHADDSWDQDAILKLLKQFYHNDVVVSIPEIKDDLEVGKAVGIGGRKEGKGHLMDESSEDTHDGIGVVSSFESKKATSGKTSNWNRAYAIVATVAVLVYATLRKSSQYNIRRVGRIHGGLRK